MITPGTMCMCDLGDVSTFIFVVSCVKRDEWYTVTFVESTVSHMYPDFNRTCVVSSTRNELSWFKNHLIRMTH